MFWKKSKSEDRAVINWQRLSSLEELEALEKTSYDRPVLIYKHSTRCGISSMTLSRLEREWTEDLNQFDCYFLNLIAHRSISNEVAERFKIYHESPQVILIRDGKAVYQASHMQISAQALSDEQ